MGARPSDSDDDDSKYDDENDDDWDDDCHDDDDDDCHDDDDDVDDGEDIVATLFKFGRKLTLLGSTTQVCY